MALIDCTNLSVGYSHKSIVENLTFCVEPGDFLCVLGENGSGKTTLMRTLLHLQKPISGKILLGDGLVPKEIGYLPQQTPAQKDFPASVLEVVLSGCLNRSGLHPFYTSSQKQQAKSNMSSLGIEELANRCYRELSGGQQQRVLLARALCASSKLLLLDEPVAGLDPDAVTDMYRILEELHRQGMAIIMITHDPEALKYASHVLHIAHTPKFFGTASDYLKTDLGRRFLLGGKGR